MSESPKWPVKVCDCKAEIVMATSVKTGSPMPFHAEPNKNGQWVLEAGADGLPQARYLSARFRFGVPEVVRVSLGRLSKRGQASAAETEPVVKTKQPAETPEERLRRILHDIAVLKIRKARRLRALRIARVRCQP